ncbi:MAG: nucleoside hydrolase [Clostridia bacterium]|nr:nucleoside hydrolase [Clostridia bacterium]
MKKNTKLKVLIDSDVCNEIDDQFAISYALANSDKLDVLGVTIAPFRVSWQPTLSIREGLLDSRNEVYRIMHLFGIKHSQENPFVFLGCEGYISEGYEKTNPAVERIISLAKENRKLCICCLGTLTNVAMALKIAPEIGKKLKIVWLGTDHLLLDEFEDSNYRKDKEAFNIVLKSEAEMTVFPATLARNFVTSIYEFNQNTKANNVSRYLYSLLEKSVFKEENWGLKELFDIGPVAYLLNSSKFKVKEIEAEILLKGEKFRLPKDRKVKYIVSAPKHFEVWKDFLASINSVKNAYLKPQIFFTSDTHFNHPHKVKEKQVSFKTVEEMNREIVRRWNSTVAPNDIVYHIGDFGDFEFIKQLNGKVILICGNHEKARYSNFEKFRQKLLDLGFVEVYENGIYLDEKILGRKVYLTHKPTNHAKDCLTLFGHVHNIKLVEKYGFNVCCYFHYFSPLTKETVKKYLDFIDKHADQDVWE